METKRQRDRLENEINEVQTRVNSLLWDVDVLLSQRDFLQEQLEDLYRYTAVVSTMSKRYNTDTADVCPAILARLDEDKALADVALIDNEYYACSGTPKNGPRIDMQVVEVRAIGSIGTHQYILIAINGICEGRHYELAGRTASLADYVRGHKFGADNKHLRVDTLDYSATQILNNLGEYKS